MKTIARTALLASLAAGSLFISACHDDDDDDVVYRGGYYGDRDVDVDFYYENRAPYSVSYGPLYYRGDRYYYRHGSRYVLYDRPTMSHDAWIRRYPHGYHRSVRVVR